MKGLKRKQVNELISRMYHYGAEPQVRIALPLLDAIWDDGRMDVILECLPRVGIDIQGAAPVSSNEWGC